MQSLCAAHTGWLAVLLFGSPVVVFISDYMTGWWQRVTHSMTLQQEKPPDSSGRRFTGNDEQEAKDSTGNVAIWQKQMVTSKKIVIVRENDTLSTIGLAHVGSMDCSCYKRTCPICLSCISPVSALNTVSVFLHPPWSYTLIGCSCPGIGLDI